MDSNKLKDLLEKSISYLANAAASIDNVASSINNRPVENLQPPPACGSERNRPMQRLLTSSSPTVENCHQLSPLLPAESNTPSIISDFRNSFPGLHGIRPGNL